MTLQNLSSAIVYPAQPDGATWPVSTGGTTTIDAAGEYYALVLVARQAMTISHVGVWPFAAAGSPNADIRIETVDPTTGLPSGTLWATDSNIVAELTTAFALHALTASASIAAGEIFAVKFAYSSGTSFGFRINSNIWGVDSLSLPYQVVNTGTPTKATLASAPRGMVLGSSTTAFHQIHALRTAGMTSVTITTFTNADGARRAVRFRLPFACRCVGLVAGGHGGVGFDITAGIYSDAGAELSNSLTNFDGDNFSGAVTGARFLYFDNPVLLAANTWYRGSLAANSASATRLDFASLASADYMAAWPGGTDWHLATFTTAGGWDDSATASVPALTLLIDQLDDGVSSGGSGGGGVLIMNRRRR